MSRMFCSPVPTLLATFCLPPKRTFFVGSRVSRDSFLGFVGQEVLVKGWSRAQMRQERGTYRSSVGEVFEGNTLGYYRI